MQYSQDPSQQSQQQGQSGQQSQQYHQEKVRRLMSNFNNPTSVSSGQAERLQRINQAGLQFAQTIQQNTSASDEQTSAIERTVEARNWADDAIRNGK